MSAVQLAAIVVAVAYVVFFLLSMLSAERQRSTVPLELRPLMTLAAPLIRLLTSLMISAKLFDPEGEQGRALKSRLAGAGIDTTELSASDFVGLCGVCGMVPALFLAAALGSLMPMATLISVMAIAVLLGSYYPRFKVYQRIEDRKAKIFAELPYVVDLLSLAIEAGLDFRRAVERLVEFSDDTPLVNELRYFLQDLEVGMSTEEALKSMASRVHVLAFFSFVEAIIQATQMGVDITPTLHAQAEQMRASYFQRVETEVNRTPILILIPTALFIFPPMLILLLTPAVVKFTSMII